MKIAEARALAQQVADGALEIVTTSVATPVWLADLADEDPSGHYIVIELSDGRTFRLEEGAQ